MKLNAQPMVLTSNSIGTTGSNDSDAHRPAGWRLHYRVQALAPGQIGFYVTAPSNVVDCPDHRRSKVDITSLISTAMSNVSFSGGVFRMDLNIKNNSANSLCAVG